MDLKNPKQRMIVAQVLADAGLYKAGDSIDYKKVKEKGLISIIGSIIFCTFTITQIDAISSLIVTIIGVSYGYIKHDKGNKMEFVLRKRGLLNSNETEIDN